MNKSAVILFGGLFLLFLAVLTIAPYLNSSDLKYSYQDYLKDIGINDSSIKVVKNCQISHDGKSYSGSECVQVSENTYHVRMCGSTVWCSLRSNKVSLEDNNGCNPQIIDNYHPRTWQAGLTGATVHYEHKETLSYELKEVRNLGHIPNCITGS